MNPEDVCQDHGRAKPCPQCLTADGEPSKLVSVTAVPLGTTGLVIALDDRGDLWCREIDVRAKRFAMALWKRVKF